MPDYARFHLKTAKADDPGWRIVKQVADRASAVIARTDTLKDGEYVLAACEHYEANRMTERELATVLAALRFAQENLPALQVFPHYHSDIEEMAADEIDALCEKLNCGEILV